SRAKAKHNGSFVWGDNSNSDVVSTADNEITFRAAGGVRFFSNSFSTVGTQLKPGANSWETISDRNRKKNILPLDGRIVLDKLAKVPISTWHYDFESEDATPHIGPMAQDFKAAFYPGRDDKGITTHEFDGVVLAAIQGLNQKLEEKNAEIGALNENVANLRALVQQLIAKGN
ncbi:MAG: tail fiber domain-containing protein, partial [Verrucomicrobia bacterium]|nr:tail fiber domain-containing protein [Verrucomicrobiota bacterium]